MSSEEEATAANVLSQMSQIQQISCETIEATVINVGHHCDVETTAAQGYFHSINSFGFWIKNVVVSNYWFEFLVNCLINYLSFQSLLES